MKLAPTPPRHVFFCTRERPAGKASCAALGAREALAHCRERLRPADPAGTPEAHVSEAGCFGRCDEGPVVVIYPEGAWYTFVDASDVDDIVDRHLVHGETVLRLRLL